MKPLGRKAYGSIPHLPGSRLGEGEHTITEGQALICSGEKLRPGDHVTVTVKLDGSCMAVANVDGKIVALGRAGYLAESSPYEQHHMFAAWVRDNEMKLRWAIPNGWRMVGEWLAQAHGTLYRLNHEPWCPFDLMRGAERAPFAFVQAAATWIGLRTPSLLMCRPYHVAPENMVLEVLHGEVDAVEGAVWRVERNGKFDFMAKWVRPDKADGCYLPQVTGEDPIWHWKPKNWDWTPKSTG